VEESRIRAEVFGLNHLSWCRSAWLDGEDLLPRALADDAYLLQAQRLFEPALVRLLGMHLNEYLYYYYYAEQAMQAIKAQALTRGEEILELNTRLVAQLERIGVERDPERALRTFFGYEQRRGATYMHYAHGGTDIAGADRQPIFDAGIFDAAIPPEAGEGYAGVALALIEALETGNPLYTALNVPNQGAIAGMRDEDVVEVSCRVDGTGVHPLPVGAVPAAQLGLMQAVKNYERLTVQAIHEHSRPLAVQALMAHPLIVSYSRARPLVAATLTAHAAYVGLERWNV
jgi:6-phospho-beta-glucosidase